MTNTPHVSPASPTAEQDDWLNVINTGHGRVTTLVNLDPVAFERFKRIYAEGDQVEIVARVKVVKP
jgi:hypothetical protein